MNKTAALLIAAFGVAAIAPAQVRTFTIPSDSKSQLAQAESKTEVETFTAKTSKVSGSIRFDAKKKTGGGRIVVDVASLATGIPLRDEHLREDRWLNAKAHPSITFEASKVKHISGDRYQVTGKFTMKGVTKEMTVEAVLRSLKASAETAKLGFKGDVVQLRTSFNVKLADHNVQITGQAVGKVSETVRISVTAYGQAG